MGRVRSLGEIGSDIFSSIVFLLLGDGNKVIKPNCIDKEVTKIK
nr:hypothetical protein [Leptospira yanagawae]